MLRFVCWLCLVGSFLGIWGCGVDFRYYRCDTDVNCEQDIHQRPLICACDKVCRATCDAKKPCLVQERCMAGFCVHEREPYTLLGISCELAEGKGVCTKGVYACLRDRIYCKIEEQVQDEICDGKDNNCNGEIDEGLSEICTNRCGVGRRECRNGTWSVCDAIDSRPCRSSNDACREGVEYCQYGEWTGICQGEVQKTPEVCDGKDNDCNGQIDENLSRHCTNACGQGNQYCVGGVWTPCNATNVRPCGTDVGECRSGVMSCRDGQWDGRCVGAVQGQSEICDDKDNNCDGKIDELWPKKNTVCIQGIGECQNIGVYRCNAAGNDVECPVTAKPPSPEICDGKDNNCDGQIDENLSRECTNVCGSGRETCAAGVWLPCDAADVRICGTGIGFCRSGAELCERGTWTGVCEGSILAKPEVCDGQDNDCNGKIDELWPIGQICNSGGTGDCKLSGKMQCTSDGKGAECSVKQPGNPKLEQCDGLDNDCDGVIDNVAPTVLTHHTKTVHSVSISANGKYLASGSADGTVYVLDWGSFSVHRSMSHGSAVHGVAFSPDNTLLVSGASDHTIKVWEVATGKLLQTWSGHIGSVLGVAFDGTGKVLASASADKTIRLWEVATGKHLGSLTGHSDAVLSVSFGLYGKILASGGLDQIGKSWNLVKGSHFDFWKQQTAVHSVSFGPRNLHLAAGFSDGAIRLYEAVDLDIFSFRFGEFRLLRTLQQHTSAVWGVNIDPYNRYVVSGGADRVVRISALSHGLELWRLSGHVGTIRSVVFSASSQEVVSGAEDGTVRIWHCLNLKIGP